MEYSKLQSFFVLVLALHQSLCQQPSTYNLQSQGKVQLEDIERDNLKSAQATSAPPSQAQTYFTYPPQDQILYNLPQQQSIPLLQPNQQSAASAPAAAPAAGSFYQVPAQQQALFTPQQQQLLYYTHTPQPVIDFAGLSLYPASGYPYVQQGSQAAHSPVPATNPIDFYKTLTTGVSGKTVAAAQQPLVKSAPAQIPNTYLLQGALQQPLYQQLALAVPQQGQFYAYNSFYPLQTPTKSLLPSGVKSTTPAIPIKGKEEQFVPIGSNNYRIEYPSQEQLGNYNKVRLSG